MKLDRIYEYRFKDVKKDIKLMTWRIIGAYIKKALRNPEIILEPGAGECEFINSFDAKEKWAIDSNSGFLNKFVASDVKALVGTVETVDLPSDYFDAVFISNFLEHLDSTDQVGVILERMYGALKQGGRMAIIGPNYKYCSKEYFDFADHKTVLTHVSLAELLHSAGFSIIKVVPRFLPISFRGRLPINRTIVKTYISVPLLWRFVGKQFLIIAEK